MKNRTDCSRSPGVFVVACIGAVCLLPWSLADAQSAADPSTALSFGAAKASFPLLRYYTFGTDPGQKIQDLTHLDQLFNPYGIATTTVINKEWERYQPFNATNFVFTPQTLDLTATIPSSGGLFSGGINSAQIWSQETFQPGKTGHSFYAFDVRMKIPGSVGMWPAFWFYSPPTGGGPTDSSEIDVAEFMDMKWQNSGDWTGNDHGPGTGAAFFSGLTNSWTWQPGIDFSDDYHDYQMIWTPDTTYKYVDGVLIYAQYFKWTSPQTAQFGINLAVGSSIWWAPGLQPTSLSQFPSVLSINRITIWAL